ncbi:serine hydrolase domain-containing protein [Dyella choica]|uniref:Class A beta-lactamase-related serine hydrolase n=1 Tax=Dyella choica TaxID=1927959 RepID=A0A3S0S0H0_9GAMM|nr:serine hydrolase domain-containing protein [Dyella choica]RUL75983.1 class A beta-lactamase-related serine hydrolase [Dyella choica]
MKTLLLTFVLTLSMAAASAEGSSSAKIDAALPRASTADIPGCAIGVQSGDSAPIRHAFGMADLEHAVPIRVDTVFEAGSVSKQFTAAATLILVSEGQLSLDDDVRKYIPEIPDYGHRITVDELLGHTSGLRDWGDIEAIAGWPRSERIYDMADVLHVVGRQRALNFNPGTAWSYTNTGYNLLAIIVQRVSGSTFADFTRDHLFVPLGMTHTQWRDDFRRVVRDRAIAYHRVSDGIYEQMMPFENTYGHGGLLTTVGDLLIWNRALDDGRVAAFVSRALQTRTLLADGHPTIYARGIFERSYHGVREMSHDGSTAGYRAWLGRYPDQHLSIAILCNADNMHTSDLAHSVADRYLPGMKSESTPYTVTPPSTLAGIYESERDGSPLRLTLRDKRLQTDAGLTVMEAADGTFAFEREDGSIAKSGVELSDGGSSHHSGGDGTVYVRAALYAPTSADLVRISGRYHNDEVPVTYQITAVADGLNVIAEGRPGQSRLFVPAYSNAFISDDMMLRLVRGPDGNVTGIRISDDRVWNLPFDRLAN